MPATIGEFRARHPEVELTLTEADPLMSIARLKSGELDLALLYEYDYVPLPEDDSVERVALADDPIRVLLPSGHRHARRRAVPLDALAEEHWITSTARSSCHEFVARSCRAAGFEPDIGFESDDHGVWQGLVAAGVGVALAPDLALENLHPGVVARPVALHPLKRRIYTAHRAGGSSPAINAMLDVLRETVAARAAPEPIAARV
jgi:DNA-binding transcriptional LysR family regulator